LEHQFWHFSAQDFSLYAKPHSSHAYKVFPDFFVSFTIQNHTCSLKISYTQKSA